MDNKDIKRIRKFYRDWKKYS